MNRWKKTVDEKAERKREKDTAGKTETFATRNVRLITFLVCISVFLAVFIPVGFWGFQTVQGWMEKDERPQMTLADVVSLSERNGELYLSDLTGFVGEQETYDMGIHYSIEIEPRYYLRAVADVATQKLYYFEMVDLETQEKVDILTEDVRAFLGQK